MAGVRGLNRPVCRPHPSPILKELVHLEKRNVEKTQDMLSRSNQASMFLCKENLATVLFSPQTSTDRCKMWRSEWSDASFSLVCVLMSVQYNSHLSNRLFKMSFSFQHKEEMRWFTLKTNVTPPGLTYTTFVMQLIKPLTIFLFTFHSDEYQISLQLNILYYDRLT